LHLRYTTLFRSQLESHAFHIQLCQDLDGATSILHSALARQTTNVIALLAGQQTQNCPVARYLRTVQPGLGVLALCHTDTDAERIALLQCGVDFLLPASTSPEVVVVAALSVLRRNLSLNHSAVFDQQEQLRHWTLVDQAWRLVSPHGRTVHLTSTEREFFKL